MVPCHLTLFSPDSMTPQSWIILATSVTAYVKICSAYSCLHSMYFSFSCPIHASNLVPKLQYWAENLMSERTTTSFPNFMIGRYLENGILKWPCFSGAVGALPFPHLLPTFPSAPPLSCNREVKMCLCQDGKDINLSTNRTFEPKENNSCNFGGVYNTRSLIG